MIASLLNPKLDKIKSKKKEGRFERLMPSIYQPE